jgi:predicted nucleic acid-binding protein
LNVFFRISIDDKNSGKYSYEDATRLLDRFIALKSVEICHPLNVFHLEGDQDFESYQKLAIKDPKDIFLLDLARYTKASYLITRDFRLIEALGGSKNNPVFYQTTMVINQGIFARSIMGI